MTIPQTHANEMTVVPASKKSLPTAAELQDWLVCYLAELLEIEPDEVDEKKAFDRYGLDSLAAVGLTGELEDWLGCKLDPTVMYYYPTIEALVKYLEKEGSLKG
jgi:acyl carrier protein